MLFVLLSPFQPAGGINDISIHSSLTSRKDITWTHCIWSQPDPTFMFYFVCVVSRMLIWWIRMAWPLWCGRLIGHTGVCKRKCFLLPLLKCKANRCDLLRSAAVLTRHGCCWRLMCQWIWVINIIRTRLCTGQFWLETLRSSVCCWTPMLTWMHRTLR